MAVPGWIKSPYLGAVAMIGAVALDAFLNNAATKVIFVAGAFQALGTLLHENHVLKKLLEPKFHLQFDSTDKTGTYVQALL